jgi:hypothetical protein
MISIVENNPYSRALEFLANSPWAAEYKLQEFLLPSLRLQSNAFRDGALIQLLACIADLRVWASQFRRLGKDELANQLDQFALDWEQEAKTYLDITGVTEAEDL